MKSTMLLSTITPGRNPRADMGCRACDERLVTLAEIKALRADGATSQLTDKRSSRRT